MFKCVFFLLLIVNVQFSVRAQTLKSDSLISAVLGSIHKDSIEGVIRDLQNFDTRFALANNRKEVAQWHYEKFINLGYTQVFLDSFLLENVEWPHGSTNFYTTWQYNVYALLKGSIDTTKKYILGAHYDAIVNPGDAFVIAPGADDNASGIAAVIEVARVFKKHHIQPKHDIYFMAFAAEELYLKGSTYQANKMYDNNKDIVLMINNDMIAYQPNPNSPWQFTIQKYPNTDWVEQLIHHVASEYTSLQAVVDNNHINYSDSYPFHLKGYDAVFIQERPFNTNLHTIFDVIDSLNMEYCTEMIKVSAAMLLEENLMPAGLLDNMQELFKVEMFPNPVNDILNIVFETHTEKQVDFLVYDLCGRLIKSINQISIPQGKKRISISFEDIPAGIYSGILMMPEQIKSFKIIKI